MTICVSEKNIFTDTVCHYQTLFLRASEKKYSKMNQPKIVRALQLLMLLSHNKYRNNHEICEAFEFSERTFFRYLDTFREAGFAVKKNEHNVYRLEISTNKLTKSLGDLLYFSEEEACILRNAIDSIDTQTKAKELLKKKLYAVYDYKVIADVAVEHHDYRILNQLQNAIEGHFQVILKNYRSAHSNTTVDRFVEPYDITSTHDQVWCYEIDTHQNKIFKISRILDVEITDRHWTYEEKHQIGYMDIFRISSTQRFHIKLLLSLRATNLLLEEYPMSSPFLTETIGNRYILSTDVCSFEGVGRFILGLYDDIEILENEELISFINYKIKMMNK